MAAGGMTASQLVVGCLTFFVVVALFVAAIVITIEFGRRALKEFRSVRQARKR